VARRFLGFKEIEMTTKTEATEKTAESTPAAATQTKAKTTAAKTKAAAEAEKAAAEAKAAEDAAKAAEVPKVEDAPVDPVPEATKADAPAGESVKVEDAPADPAPEKTAEVEAPKAKDSFNLEVTNNGPRSFEVFTKKPLPAGETVLIECANIRQFRMVKSKFNQLNALAKSERYTVKEV